MEKRDRNTGAAGWYPDNLKGSGAAHKCRMLIAGLQNSFSGLLTLTGMLCMAMVMTGCSKDEALVPTDPEEEFRFHLYVVPGESEKASTSLEVIINVDGKNYSYTSENNEVIHTMKVKVPSSVNVSFVARTTTSSTFHFRAYQGEQPVWGGGSGCRSSSYTKKDKIHFYR